MNPTSRPRKGTRRISPGNGNFPHRGNGIPDDLLEDCRSRAVDLLVRNSSPHGILACSASPAAEHRNYRSIFGRDASICAFGMVASGDPRLIRTAGAGLRCLARFQASNGQIPNYVKPERREANFWQFGCIDATLWWLIALKFYDRFSGDRTVLPSLGARVEKAVSWLACQEQPHRGLLVQNEASDWADIMPRSGHVLYSNALWYRVKNLYRIPGVGRTKAQFQRIFFPFSSNGNGPGRDGFYTIDRIRRALPPTSYYLSFVHYLSWGEDIDLFGNALAILFGLPEGGLGRRILGFLGRESRSAADALPVVLNPIRKGSRRWREYMGRHGLNAPHQYHNGGVWPFAGCFLAMAFAKGGSPSLALRELRKVAGLNRVNDWQFNEWFHGSTRRPMGMPGQSWNAAMFLMAYHSLRSGITI